MAPPLLKPRGSVFNARTVTAPIAALTMAVLLYTYSVTSIRAAKRNAQLHRQADGGQLDMRRESLRRHGVLEKVQGTSGVELFRDVRGGGTEEGKMAKEESKVFMGNSRARKLGEGDVNGGGGGGGREKEEEVKREPRTEVEGGLEGYKGRGKAVGRFKEERPAVPVE